MTIALIGNSRAAGAVQRALAGPSPPHAWLFVGPEGVGKATLARWLAQVVNCERNKEPGTGNKTALTDPGVEPCGKCSQCQRIARGIHTDVMTVAIPPAEDGPQHKEISVDQIRDVERAVALAPFEGRTRVIIIDPAERLSEEAQNAFLKTLEEPPPNAVFVLVATREDALLPTVRSRCRRFEFGLVPAGEIEQSLMESLTPGPLRVLPQSQPPTQGRHSPDARERGDESSESNLHRARLLSRLASGRPGRALEMVSDPSRLDKRRQMLEQASALAAMPMGDLMDLSERLSRRFREDREDVLERLAAWLAWWRDVLLTQSGAADGVTSVDMPDALGEDASRYEPAQVVAFVQALAQCRERLESNVQARIALDALMVMAPRVMAAAGR